MANPSQGGGAKLPILSKAEGAFVKDSGVAELVNGGSKTRFLSLGVGFLLGLLLLIPPQDAPATGLSDALQIGTAFLVHLGVHESGHYIMASMAGAEDVDLAFFTKRGKNFYLGLSTAKGLDGESRAPYKMAGEATASYHFEIMLPFESLFEEERTRGAVIVTLLALLELIRLRLVGVQQFRVYETIWISKAVQEEEGP